MRDLVSEAARRDADRAHAEYMDLYRRHAAGELLTVAQYVRLFGPWYVQQLESAPRPRKEPPCA